jgi:hypothetical protein
MQAIRVAPAVPPGSAPETRGNARATPERFTGDLTSARWTRDARSGARAISLRKRPHAAPRGGAVNHCGCGAQAAQRVAVPASVRPHCWQ